MNAGIPPPAAGAAAFQADTGFLTLELALDAAEVGGKALALARLLAAGEAVPPGVVIPRGVFESWLDESGLREPIARFERDLDPADVQAARAAGENIRGRILASPLPESVRRCLGEVGEAMLSHAPLVVRSSAVGEDSATHSFAGQLDSILHVRSAAELSRAVVACWASYWSDRVLTYRRSGHAALAGMGVIVQRQVDAVEAGVLFTRHPTDPTGATMLVESCAGLADALVSGRVEPVQRTILRAAAAGDPLGRAGLRLETLFGRPQDVEWARDRGGTLWIVQSRAITTCAPEPAPGRPQVVWSNANVCENFPAPVSPLLYSIASAGYSHYFRNLARAFGLSRRRLRPVEGAFASIIGLHGARIYYNLSSIHAILRVAPLGERLADAFNTFVGAPPTPPEPDAAGAWRRFAERMDLGRVVACVVWQYLFFGRRLRTFERTVDAFASAVRPESLASRTLPELGRDLAGFMEIRCHRWKDAGLADAGAMVTYALLRRVLQSAGAPDATANRLLRALPGVPSSEPPRRLWALSRLIRAQEDLRRLFAHESTPSVLARLDRDPAFAAFRRELQRYLEDWGFRSSAELMLTVPSLQEEPAPLVDLLRQYALTGGEPPEATMSRQAGERIAETRRLLRSLAWRAPWRALAAWVVLRAAQRSIAYRERARVKQALLYSRCRQVALAVGTRLVAEGRLPDRDAVFMLTYAEVLELTDGRALFADGLAELVAARRREHAALSATHPPDRLVLARGATYRPGMASARGPAPTQPLPAGRRLSGASACGGRASARAAVLGDVNESHRLQRGDILVTRQTDPGWGPVFCLVSGLVIERGGMLSHGAIIAREFGLPCVVGIASASTLIPHGAHLTVDGDAGTVVLGDPPGAEPVTPLPTQPVAPTLASFAAYLRERVRAGVFVPAISAIALLAAWSARRLDAGSVAAAFGFAALLVLQFRLWDDLADRDRDRVEHPGRVLGRVDPFPFETLAAMLALAALGLVAFVGGTVPVLVLGSLELAFASLYAGGRRLLPPRAWQFPVLLAKYPAFVAVVGLVLGAVPATRLGAAMAGAYVAALAYEAFESARRPDSEP